MPFLTQSVIVVEVNSSNPAMMKFSSRGKRCDVKFPLESALKGNLRALTLVLNTWALHGEEFAPKWTPIELNCWLVLWIKTGIRLNEDAIRPDQAREQGRQNWWACPPALVLLWMTSKLQERTPKSVQSGNYGHKITENYVSEGSPPEFPALCNLKEAWKALDTRTRNGRLTRRDKRKIKQLL